MFDRTSLHVALLLWGCIFSLIATLCMFMSSNFNKEKRRWLLSIQATSALLLLSDAFAWEFRGRPGTAMYWIVVISNLLVFVLSDCMLAEYNGYVSCILFGSRNNRKTKRVPDKRIRLVYIIAATGALLVVISQFTHLYYYIDADNYYHRSPAHFISMIIPIAGMIIDASIVIENRKNIKRLTLVSLLSYMILPLSAGIIQIFYYGISLTNIAISISMILMFVEAMIEQNENLARKEKEAADLRISIMISQIAPHFIYNILTSIQSMCISDPELARETISEFASYLRGNLESLSQTDNVPFDRELKHVECYLAIEKKRFGSKINVEYDIKEKEFLLPALTLQPIVENAVKYGLCKKKGGGTVRISTMRQGRNVIIIVEDDGIGFNVKEAAIKAQTDKKLHVGISNVKNRISDMCNGTISVESKPEEGTRVTITLPQ